MICVGGGEHADKASVAHDGDVAGHVAGSVKVVSGHQDCDPSLAQSGELVAKVTRGGWVQTARGFV